MEPVYSFDRIRINTFKEPETLKEQLPVDELKRHSKSFQIDHVSYMRQYTGYKSRIDFTAPTPEFLDLLFENEKALGPYKISYVEIAKDRITDTEQAAINAVQNLSFRKKWATKTFNFVEPEDLPEKKDGCFGPITKYSESRDFGIKAYARNSKITGDQCSHHEWRIKTPGVIQKKSGISEIGNCIGFNFHNFFKIQDEKFLIYNEKADQFKVGKFIVGAGRRKYFAKREEWSIGCHGAAYTSGKNYGELVQNFKRIKREIEREVKGRPGPKTAWERKFLNLKNYTRFRAV